MNTMAELVMKPGTVLSLPSGSNLAPKLFIDEGCSVSGAGEFSPGATISATSVTAAADDIVYDPLLSADAWFHVDASQTNLLGITSDNPTNVYCWSDVRGRRPASDSDKPNDGGRYAWKHEYATDYPFLNVGYLNGLPVMDFGPIAIRDGNTDDDIIKRSFKWKDDCKEARTILVVVGDNEKAKERHNDGSGDFYKRNQPFIGSSGTFVLRPNRSPSYNSPYLHSLAGAGTSTKFWCDGEAVSSPTSTAYPDGMHLVTIEPQNVYADNANAHCDAFACERNNNLHGGQRIAECLVFTNKLSDAERNAFETLMLAKWFGSNGVARTYANVTVATNASLAMKYQRLSVTGKLTLGGTLKAEQVQVGDAAAIELTAPAAIDGELALPAGNAATITLSGPAWSGYRDEKVKILGATAVTGMNPVGVLDSSPRGRRVFVSVEPDGLYATFVPKGFIVSIR